MTRPKLTIIALSVLLIATNAWWAYQTFDQGVTLAYSEMSLEEHKQALEQTLSIFDLVASGQGTRENIIRNMETEFGIDDGFEKDGIFWMGKIGLRFDDSGNLLEVQPAWNQI